MTQYQPPEIIRTKDFEVASMQKNQYGDLVVTDALGEVYKIGKKRDKLFPIFQPGVSVHVCYATFMNKEYIADAVQSKPEQMHGSIEETAPVVKATTKLPTCSEAKSISGQEFGMWWKELGEMIRAKDIDVTKPEGKLLRIAYYKQMLSVLNIKIEKEG